MSNPKLANTFRLLAKQGKPGFYQGTVAKELVKVVQNLGGHITLEDLKYHADTGTEPTEPVSLKFNGQNIGAVQSKGLDGQPSQSTPAHGVEIWEHPPNGQGMVALMALGILEELEKTGVIRTFTEKDHNGARIPARRYRSPPNRLRRRSLVRHRPQRHQSPHQRNDSSPIPRRTRKIVRPEEIIKPPNARLTSTQPMRYGLPSYHRQRRKRLLLHQQQLRWLRYLHHP